MSLRLLKLPFRAAGTLFGLLFVGGMLELLGMLFYLQWRDPAALRSLTAGGVRPGEIVPFLLASPDRMLVAGVLALVAVGLVLSDSSSGRTHRHHHADGGFDGDADGDGGGFGGDGGGFGGDGGGGGGGGE